MSRRLEFRLTGTWWNIPLDSDRSSNREINRIVRNELGTSDEHASSRARLRHELRYAARLAREHHMRLLLMSTALPNGTPMPLTITVSEPEELRMSPAVGTSPDRVLATLEESLRIINRTEFADAVRRRSESGDVLRTHELVPRSYDDGTGSIRELRVHYWYPVPGTKQVTLVTFTTPLGDIPHVMLAYTDAIVRASYLSDEDADS